jgi:hypothetical protein
MTEPDAATSWSMRDNSRLQPAPVNNARVGFKFMVKRAPLNQLYLNAYAKPAAEFTSQSFQEQGMMLDLVEEHML